MAKVIVERPRHKGWWSYKPKGYFRKLRKYGDNAPIREGIKQRWLNHTKWLNEHLGPLRRFLDSQVGRPWDKVFAEICKHINRNSAVQDHVRDHVEDYVVTHVILVNGVPCSGAGDRSYGTPLNELRWRPWYVCPRTGILRRNRTRSQRELKQARRQKTSRRVRISNTLQFHQRAGTWYLVTLKPLPLEPALCTARDAWLSRAVARMDLATAQKHYGAAVYADSVQPIAKRELKQYPIPYDLWK